MSDDHPLIAHDGREQFDVGHPTDPMEAERRYLWRVGLTLPQLGGRFQPPSALADTWSDRDLYEMPAFLRLLEADDGRPVDPASLDLDEALAGVAHHVDDETYREVCAVIERREAETF